MQSDHDEDTNQDELPHADPIIASAIDDETGGSAAEAASELGDANPVFGSNLQPQEVLDRQLIGTDNDKAEPFKSTDIVANFDPENDPRMTEPLGE